MVEEINENVQKGGIRWLNVVCHLESHVHQSYNAANLIDASDLKNLVDTKLAKNMAWAS